MSAERDERLAVLAAAVLWGEPSAADALHRRMRERGLDKSRRQQPLEHRLSRLTRATTLG
jgi:hypothetical protein